MTIDFQKLETIFNRSFIKELILSGANVYLVGGHVRDLFLEKEAKDVDLVVQNIKLHKIKKILSSHGRLDLVGESFGVIKFKERNSSDSFEVEIALPRKDSLDKAKKGHKAIIAQSNPSLPITVDLKRRDFTINSIAIKHDLTLIDPFDGVYDIHSKTIRATDAEAFVDDPLRMIRAIQFASRFSFAIEPKTLALIKLYAPLIKEITSERILIEFEKVVHKNGDITIFLDLMKETGLWEQIFGFKLQDFNCSFNITTISELLYISVKGYETPIHNWANFFAEKLKIDNKTYKELRALEIINEAGINNLHLIDHRKDYFKGLLVCSWALELDSFVLPGIDKREFENNIYPISYKHLDISGEELMALGLIGKQIGDMQKKLVELILENKVRNENKQIKKFIKISY